MEDLYVSDFLVRFFLALFLLRTLFVSLRFLLSLRLFYFHIDSDNFLSTGGLASDLKFTEKRSQWRRFAKEFNAKPKRALPLLSELSLANPLNPTDIAMIFMECPGPLLPPSPSLLLPFSLPLSLSLSFFFVLICLTLSW
jgi:hypothetical protein